MLKLSDYSFNAAMEKKMPPRSIVNTLDTNKRLPEINRQFQQRCRRYKEEPNGPFRIENATTKTNSLLGGFNSRRKGAQKRISELKNRIKYIIQSELYWEYGIKKKKTVSRTFGTITKDLTLKPLEIWKKRRKREEHKSTQSNNN